jgi:hypothetical protein
MTIETFQPSLKNEKIDTERRSSFANQKAGIHSQTLLTPKIAVSVCIPQTVTTLTKVMKTKHNEISHYHK